MQTNINLYFGYFYLAFWVLILILIYKIVTWIYSIKKNSDTTKGYLKIQTKVLLEIAKKQGIEVNMEKDYKHEFVD